MLEKMNLGRSQMVKSMSVASPNMSRKSSDGVPDQFPAGLRVLVVDDDPTCLRILEKMLITCLYRVTKCNRAEAALNLLRENKNGFDVVLSDVHMPDMDGFKLLEQIGLEMDLPVIMMSADDSKHVVMRGVIHGACDYLIKPVRMEALKNIWQHVLRKRKHGLKEKEIEQSESVEEDQSQKPVEDVEFSPSGGNEGSWKNSKKRKDEDDDGEDRDDSSNLKKPRVVWSVELHQQFVDAVNQLGIDKAVPKKILELMNVPGLTRENVASHLQKYRLYLRRISGSSQHPGGINNSFLGTQDAAFASLSSLSGIDFQALAASGQLPAQSLATIQAAALGRSTPKSAISVPLVDQRNLFSFENPKLRFNEGPQQNKPMNLLHGIPTSMDSKQLASLQQSAQPFRSMNVQAHPHRTQTSSLRGQMVRPQTNNPMLNDSRGGHVGQPILGHAISVDGDRVENVRGPSSVGNFSMNPSSAMGGGSFPVISDSGTKGSRGFAQSYDVLGELVQGRNSEWGLQDVGSNFGASHLQGTSRVAPSTFVHQHGFSSNGEQSGNMAVSKAGYPMGSGVLGGNSSDGDQFSSSDNLLRIKAEKLPNMGLQNNIFPGGQYDQEDLMSALLKQQQTSMGLAENEYGYDGYHLDNLPA